MSHKNDKFLIGPKAVHCFSRKILRWFLLFDAVFIFGVKKKAMAKQHSDCADETVMTSG